jgi:TPP-dependent pyruvate/acetoin dehydrogenase alpha subunit
MNEKRKMKRGKGSIDCSETFDEFLAKEGLLAEAEDTAIKEIIADQIKVAMDKQHLSKSAMAARMRTSRRQLDRLLDPNNPSVTLATLRRAATAVGRQLRIELK